MCLICCLFVFFFMIGHLHVACVSLTLCLLWLIIICNFFFSCSEEKSDEVTHLLGEVRSVLYLLTCLVKLDTFLKLYCA